ncbi:MAG: exosortase-associated EpsI family protein [Thermoguttaceae bacterium]
MSEVNKTTVVSGAGDTEQTTPEKGGQSGLIVRVVVVLLLTAVMTYVAGANWGRWGGFSKQMENASQSLELIPKSFGDWEAGEDEQLNQTSVDMLELADYIVRQFVNQKTGERVSVLMMVGPTGRLVVHTPQVCFGGRNFKMMSDPIPVSFPGTGKEANNLSKLVFKNQSMNGGTKIFYYGVSTGGPWMPITNTSRYDLQGNRFLYKLQLEAFVKDEFERDDCIKRFLNEFLPLIEGKMVSCNQ